MPPDMSGTSLLGGGLIAGDALAALGLGIAGLARHRVLGAADQPGSSTLLTTWMTPLDW
jgi:F0F1-type ATP synthase membrane subunit c/vacuolar-type H+-ATPase subunit K